MAEKRDTVIGFKATDENGACNPVLWIRQKYEVGGIYKLPEAGTEYDPVHRGPHLCRRGFHFCERLYEVFAYYPVSAFTRVFEVEALGVVVKQGRFPETRSHGKCVTDVLRIRRELPHNEILDRIRRESRRVVYPMWQRDFAETVLEGLVSAYELIPEDSVACQTR